ncbi:T4 family baseplate hub assembly chaperone [Actinoplanes awajinensis]|uniref:Uncharacterized protein n=1 Tax=Actinoplanes awajinensis subsp. mycoplanecinus TaxID=135947 RepID=A0A101JEX6_9ACTN|nr:hypothetical protein [Actinoplanes awajinensis]KUL25593.1 hypothetical protein ADL15_40320 [Actinoplanes awajinensis subsp. mycoplanecinus]
MSTIPAPAGSRPRSFAVDLPVGVPAGDARRRDAELRKMCGYEEALLGDETLDGVRLVTELLAACTLRLGDVERPDRAIIERLFVADRDYLLLELRRISYGDGLSAGYPCPRCGVETVVEEDLASLPVDRLALDAPVPAPRVELEDGYLDRHGNRHTTVVLRLPRGSDEAFVSLALPNGRAQAQDALMLRCIETFGSLSRADLDAFGSKVLRELTVGDRARLVGALRGGPGVRWQRQVPCLGCGQTAAHTLDVSDFFPNG